MNKILKRVLVVILVLALLGGGTFAGLWFLGKRNRKPVNVYDMQQLVMTDYYADETQTYGMVSTTGLQNVYISETQQITEIYVAEGQSIKSGDPVLAFDTTLTDIELEKAKLNLEKLKLQLENTNAELEYISKLRPFSMVLITPPQREIVLTPEHTPQILEGKGTQDEPYYILWNRSTGMTVRYLESLFPQKPEAPAEGADPGEEPSEPVDYDHVWAVFVIRDQNALNGQVLDYYGLKLDRSEGSLRFNVFRAVLPDSMLEYDHQEEPYWKSYGSSYTAKELAQMKEETEQKIKDLTLDIEMAQVELQRLEREMNDGMVTSRIDGVVKTVRDPEEARLTGQPVVELSAGGGYYVDISVGELDLAVITVGQTVTVRSWENYASYEGTIVEISDYPQTDAQGWSNGNQNISWYGARVFIDESAQLREYEYVDVTYSATHSEEGAWYLVNMFIRQEGGVSYVMVKGADGLLERRIVQTGKSIWGEYTQIRGGLSMDERIAFPYGKNVKEGAETVDAEISELYGGGFYY